MIPVRSVRPPAPWLGGKRALSKRLTEVFDEIEHNRYVEVFVGMGGPFFRRTRRPKMEVINDISRDVVNLFRLLQRHFPQLLDTLKWQLSSRAEFERLAATDPDTLTDLERAARFLYLQLAGFGGMGKNFGTGVEAGARFDLTKLVPVLEDVHERLASVHIEQLPFDRCIARYDSRPGTLFYCDPPYWGHENDYGEGIFSRADFERLRDLLAGIQGRFVLSINDVPEIRELFAGFAIEEVQLNYRASGKVTPARELIITGP